MWRITDRLSPTDVESLVESYRGGGTMKTVAERYGVSVATVKRLAREHGVQNSDHAAFPEATDSGGDAGGRLHDDSA